MEKRSKCILKESEGKGARVFWCSPCDTTDRDFNELFCRIYDTESQVEPSAIIHSSNVIKLPADTLLEKKFGCLYPVSAAFEKLKGIWKSNTKS